MTVEPESGAGDLPLAELLTRQLPRLKAFLRIRAAGLVSERESIDDLAQSVCRELLENLDGFEFKGEEQFRKWLFLQASRKVVDRWRYHHRARRDVGREAARLDDSEAGALLEQYATFCTPSRMLAAGQEVERIEAALQQLPENQRNAVVLSRMVGLSYDEIAEQLAVSRDSARGLVARGLARLVALVPPSE